MSLAKAARESAIHQSRPHQGERTPGQHSKLPIAAGRPDRGQGLFQTARTRTGSDRPARARCSRIYRSRSFQDDGQIFPGAGTGRGALPGHDGTASRDRILFALISTSARNRKAALEAAFLFGSTKEFQLIVLSHSLNGEPVSMSPRNTQGSGHYPTARPCSVFAVEKCAVSRALKRRPYAEASTLTGIPDSLNTGAMGDEIGAAIGPNCAFFSIARALRHHAGGRQAQTQNGNRAANRDRACAKV